MDRLQTCAMYIHMYFPGLSDAHNLFSVKPCYKFWASWLGPRMRKSHKLINTEHKKCRHDLDEAEFGTRKKINSEDVIEILEQGSVSRILYFDIRSMNCDGYASKMRELCKNLSIADSAKLARLT